MTKEEIQTLEDAAKKATPGPWYVRPQAESTIGDVLDGNDNDNFHVTTWKGKHDAAFVSAANPTAILSLIAAHRKVLDYIEYVNKLVDTMRDVSRYLRHSLDATQTKLEKAKEALEFYAREANWEPENLDNEFRRSINSDDISDVGENEYFDHVGGQQARAALKELETK